MEEVLPHALLIGVDYNLFWELSPSGLEPFNKAFELQQKNINEQAWMHGLYVRMAIGSSMSKKVKYPKSPLGSSPKNARMSAEDMRNKMLRTMKTVNSQMRKE